MARWLRLTLALIGASALTALPLTAQADGAAIDEARIVAVVEADGTLAITQTLVFADGAGEVVQALPATRDIDSTHFFRYGVDGVRTDGAAAAAVTSGPEGHRIVWTAEAAGEATLTYRVVGAARTELSQEGDLTVVEWPMLTGLSADVTRVDVVVRGPGAPQLMNCTAGPVGGVGQCAAQSGGTFEQPEPQFRDADVAPGDEIVVAVGYTPQDVAANADVVERWSLDRAFELSWSSVLISLLVGLLGAGLIWLTYRRAGRDQTTGGATAVASFVPVGDGVSEFRVHGDVRPGHVGTVADERVDPLDVTATLLDLAVRGHLRITELPHEQHGLLDWSLERRPSEAPLATFEAELLDLVVPAGRRTLVSELSDTVAQGIGGVQDALYAEVVDRGWFDSRPDATRSSWRTLGYLAVGVAVVAGIALVAWTHLGLLALVLLAVAAGLVWASDRMPRRTAAGSALLSGLHALAGTLATQPTDQLPPGRELPAVSSLLGYTVVLGSKERWLEALVAADADADAPDPDTLDWYHAPATWHLQDLPASLTQLITALQGRLTGR